MAAVVSTVSRYDLTIDVSRKNQPNKNNLTQHKPLLLFSQSFKTVAYKQQDGAFQLRIKVGVVYVGRCTDFEAFKRRAVLNYR